MRSLGVVDLKMDGDLRFLSWEKQLLAVVDDYERRAVVAIDPRSLTVLERHPLDGTILQVERGAAGQVVLLLGPKQGIGQLRLAVVGGEGMTVTPIPQVTGGSSVQRDGDDVHAREVIPALVVDRAGRRAFVYEERAVVEISPRTRALPSTRCQSPCRSCGAFATGSSPRRRRSSSRAPTGAASGSATGVSPSAARTSRRRKRPGGARHRGHGELDAAQGRGHRLGGGGQRRHAAHVRLQHRRGHTRLRPRGERALHLLRGESAWIQVAGGRHAQIGEGERIAVIDTATGRVLTKANVDTARHSGRRPSTLPEVTAYIA